MSDDGGRDWARTRTSDATTPPPARARAEREAVAEGAAGAADASLPADAPLGPAPRSSLLVQTAVPAAVGAVLAAAAWTATGTGVAPLVLAVVVLQALVVVAVLALLDAPAVPGSAVVAGLAAAAADVAVVADDGRLDRLAEVVGLALVASLLHQLVRRGRSRVTESLAATCLAVLAAVAAACLLAPSAGGGDEPALAVVLVAAAVALGAGRLADRWLPGTHVAPGTTRGWPGLVLAALAGTGAALLLGGADGTARTALAALAAVVCVLVVDLAVDLGAGELRAGPRDARRVQALLPTRALLPYALLAPVAALVLGGPVS